MIHSHTGIIRPSLDEIVAMPKEEGDRWMNHILCISTMRAMKLQSELRAQKEFNQLERANEAPDWCQVELKRNKSQHKEIWLMFTPGDKMAEKHPSYYFFKDALESGSTILASRQSMGWNCLLEDDEICTIVYSSNLKMSQYEMLNRGKKLQKYGI